MIGIWISMIAVAAVSSFGVGWVLRQNVGKKRVRNADETAKKFLAEAKLESEDFKREKILEAKDEIFQARQKFETETKERSAKIQEVEERLSSRELDLDRKVDLLNKKEKAVEQQRAQLKSRQESVNRKEEELDRLIGEENVKLEQISGLTSEEAKKIQMANMLEVARQETAEEIHEIRNEAKKKAADEAREIIIQALQRSSISHIVDSTVAVVQLPDDEMKGRIIGREGRNIRAFESATGVEVLIDDTPQTVVLSGFDPVRREVARQSLEKLIYDGRIHPGRIEEVVTKTHEEMDERIFEVGEQVQQELGLHSMHHELLRMIGKQQFRTSYGQNLLQHSKEVATLAGEMAALLGLDITLARRAGILHDVGKTAEDYGEAPYYEIGAELAKKFGENEVVQNAIVSQAPGFDEQDIISPISVLVSIADGISVSRPGAQKETLDNYIKRMNRLEEIAGSFDGVIKSYAIQAGRELRVLVEHSLVDDTKAQLTADNIVSKIRDEMEFPGQIKVTVIREYRSFDYAK